MTVESSHLEAELDGFVLSVEEYEQARHNPAAQSNHSRKPISNGGSHYWKKQGHRQSTYRYKNNRD
jgi:hypothetical protein